MNHRHRVKVERRFLGLMTVSDQAGEEIDDEIDRIAVARMLNLRDVFRLVVDRFHNGPFAQQGLVVST